MRGYISDSVLTNLYVVCVVYLAGQIQPLTLNRIDRLPMDILVNSCSVFYSIAACVLVWDYIKTYSSYRSLDEAIELLDTPMPIPSSAATKVKTKRAMPADPQNSEEVNNTLLHRRIKR